MTKAKHMALCHLNYLNNIECSLASNKYFTDDSNIN